MPAAKKYYNWKKYDVSRYTIPMRPLKRRYVDPGKIKHISGYHHHGYPVKYMMGQFGSVCSGDWDKNRSSFEKEKVIYESIKQRFKQGVDWNETPYVKEALKMVKQGDRKWHNCNSKQDIENRCDLLDKIYYDMKDNGYKSQQKIDGNVSYPRELVNEILVDISRDGEPLFVDGKHRLSMAKVLNIDEIPITVMVRHKLWLEKLESQYNRGDLLSHMDVAHIAKKP